MIAQEIAAGRELDALIAEKVMGWEVVRFHGDATSTPYVLDRLLGSLSVIDRTRAGEDEPFSPSTDIAAAWLVLGEFTSYDLGYEGEVNGETSCTVGYWPGSKYVYAKATVRGNDAPLAICRAALRAIG